MASREPPARSPARDLASVARALDAGRIDVAAGDTAALRALASERDIFVVIGGVLIRNVVIGRQPRAELLGEGDLIRPAGGGGDAPAAVRWEVLLPATLARIDAALLDAASRHPQLIAEIASRGVHRAQRLAHQLAIGDLRSVSDRIVSTFEQLAARWGRVTPEGIVVPLPLTHELIGRIVGAQRPTVTSALSALAREGRLARRGDRTWILAATAP